MLKVSKRDVEPDKPGSKHRSNRPRSSGPSSTRLRANKLLVKAKQFTTKPVTKKYPDPISSAPPDTVPVETPAPTASEVHVETDDVSTDEYKPPELPVVTGNITASSVATDSVKPKNKRGKVSIKSYVLRKKNKVPRTAYCKLCEFSCAGVRALNEHHRSDHGIQFCPVCNKGLIPKPLLISTRMCMVRTNLFVTSVAKHSLFLADWSNTNLPIRMCIYFV